MSSPMTAWKRTASPGGIRTSGVPWSASWRNLKVDVYHFHHYWRIGFDLIADLIEARPEATFVITLHEMLAICLNHGQMVKTNGWELCRTESAVRCLSCFPGHERSTRLLLRKAYMLTGLRRRGPRHLLLGIPAVPLCGLGRGDARLSAGKLSGG